jgi:hypothetical protein
MNISRAYRHRVAHSGRRQSPRERHYNEVNRVHSNLPPHVGMAAILFFYVSGEFQSFIFQGGAGLWKRSDPVFLRGLACSIRGNLAKLCAGDAGKKVKIPGIS